MSPINAKVMKPAHLSSKHLCAAQSAEPEHARGAALDSNASLKDSATHSASFQNQLVAGRLSCGGDARSLGTDESRANLTADRELKRIYHNKLLVIGRDSNGALLSRKELVELKVNQAKQVARSLMAGEKRKLQHMSKLKPVLDASRDEAAGASLPPARPDKSRSSSRGLPEPQSAETFHKPNGARADSPEAAGADCSTPERVSAAKLPDMPASVQQQAA